MAEDYFKTVIGDNYYSPHHFWFELDHAQTNKLISRLSSLAFAPGSYQPYYVEKRKHLLHPTPLPDKRNSSRIIKRSAPIPEVNITSDRSTGSSSSDATRGTDDGKHKEGSVNLQLVNEAEKDLLYKKLKELALNRERLNSYLVDSARDTTAVNGLSSNKNEIPGGEKTSEDMNELEPVVSSGAQPSTVSDTPPSIISSDNQPAIAQVFVCSRPISAS